MTDRLLVPNSIFSSAPTPWARSRLCLVLMLCSLFDVLEGNSQAQGLTEADFLPPEQAFRLSAEVVTPNLLQLRFDIANGYYLYHDQFDFGVEPEAAAAFIGAAHVPPGEVIFDQVFEKDLETHRHEVVIDLPLQGAPEPFVLQVTSQGCADAGLCYPPQTWPVSLDVAGGGWAVQAATLTENRWGGGSGFADWRNATDLGLAEALGGAALWQTVAVFFALGLLLSLTPCVLPMLPILSALLVGDQAARQAQGQHTGRWRGLGLAAAYVLGMSLIYTLAGVAAGLTGASLAATLQTPWVLSLFAAILVVLALAMFNVFTVQVPARWQTALTTQVNRLPGGRITGAFGMGAISALIVGPCVAAPLAGALLYISQTGDVWLGGLALFAMAWGMGVSLLVAGASASTLLPRAGAWMEGVKQFFGVLLLAVAWWMLLPVLPSWVQMVGWALLAFFTASLLGAFNALPEAAGVGRRSAKGMGWVLALVGAIQLVGLSSGGRDPLQPLAHWGGGSATSWQQASISAAGGGSTDARSTGSAVIAGSGGEFGGKAGAFTSVNSAGAGVWGSGQTPNSDWLTSGSSGVAAAAAEAAGQAGFPTIANNAAYPPFIAVQSLADLNRVIEQAQGRPVMLDFYADWCVSCKEMERFTFSDPAVAQRMSQMVLVQADVTANNDEHRELLKRFRLFGPPGIIFFDGEGREQTQTRVVGFQNAERFGAVLDQVLARG